MRPGFSASICVASSSIKATRFAASRDLFIVSDLAYCDIVFEGAAPSMLQVPGARERTLEFMSLSKSYNMAGWRVGIAAGNAALVAAMARVKSYLDYGLFGATQVAARVALDECDAYAVENRDRWERACLEGIRMKRDAEGGGGDGAGTLPDVHLRMRIGIQSGTETHTGPIYFARRGCCARLHILVEGRRLDLRDGGRSRRQQAAAKYPA